MLICLTFYWSSSVLFHHSSYLRKKYKVLYHISHIPFNPTLPSLNPLNVHFSAALPKAVICRLYSQNIPLLLFFHSFYSHVVSLWPRFTPHFTPLPGGFQVIQFTLDSSTYQALKWDNNTKEERILTIVCLSGAKLRKMLDDGRCGRPLLMFGLLYFEKLFLFNTFLFTFHFFVLFTSSLLRPKTGHFCDEFPVFFCAKYFCFCLRLIVFYLYRGEWRKLNSFCETFNEFVVLMLGCFLEGVEKMLTKRRAKTINNATRFFVHKKTVLLRSFYFLFHARYLHHHNSSLAFQSVV